MNDTLVSGPSKWDEPNLGEGPSSPAIPLLVKAWYVLAGLALLGIGNPLLILTGVRLDHAYYYFELLLPFTLTIAVLFHRRAPLSLRLFLVWVCMAGAHGAFSGGDLSWVYDRFRTLMVLSLLIVLHAYGVSGSGMLRLARPLFVCGMLGAVLGVFWPLGGEKSFYLTDVLNFSFIGAAYAAHRLFREGRLRPQYPVMIMIPLGYAVFYAARAKFLVMVAALLIPILFDVSRLRLRALLGILGMGVALLLVALYAPRHEAFLWKGIFAGGLETEALQHTSQGRLNEFHAIVADMSAMQLIYGKGLGASWYGGTAMFGEGAAVRYGFHIYYFEVVWQMGLIGLVLFTAVFVWPTVRGLARFGSLDPVGQIGVVSMVALLLGFFGSASKSFNESMYAVTALYCISISLDRRMGQQQA